ncbi:ABC transporter permease [Ponticoccus sp. SC2-23]|uniref:ABC transporter permease n=1 Tax=Alexandriicola marinus TaxID=2081710 RepID=UPI000FDA4E4B|nr:ABC transporter permease [Alexandriicola marinus]MBM1220001.1 ABC transporter permease [Ponticoccus sp. SC6-9]MBM1224687.1 ABC transporter permease [Ponticoccus sp. SC6-15]MBM1228200.1 ABC transporter permease [Ponticoccus sp. SC6-38]MBM1234162.1 ABC transporter permease [Ponticoccus sp. SC6-45]MBM1238702.1 ABC transporter permease [Ponticoccus sp. SC6-49]MBM1242483.1 ABC transporter permease [Ponticoccus sp. SC2-64]MBM1247686.1 ABC transporter permease [Ponticoccus sp. SC6-42]MBM1251655
MLQFVRFVATRAVMALTTLVIVSLVVFTLMELVPGDCAERYLAFKNTQGSGISQADIEIERQRLGLDRPFIERWAKWIVGAFQGDFGDSCILRVDIAQLLGTKFWLSLAICLSSLTLAYAIAIPVGIYSAASNNAWLNNSLKFISYFGLAMPNFLLALMIMLASTIWFGETLTGLFSPEYRDAPWTWAKFRDLLSHAWLPIFILGWSATAFALQTVRALMSDEIGKLYVTAAAARGVSGRRLLWRYPARHALGPIVNSLGFDLNRIFNELPIVALILVLTDAGALLIEALARSNDQQLAGAIIFLLTASIVTLNFLTDVLLAVLDPRVRKSIMR